MPPVRIDTDGQARILRFLAAHKIIEEPSPGHWAGSSWTQDLAHEGNLSGIKHQCVGDAVSTTINILTSYRFETGGPSYNAIPSFLRSTGFRNVDDSKNCPFQQGHNTEKGCFEWLVGRSDKLDYLMRFLPKQREGRHWTDTDIVQDLARKSIDDTTVLFVDVGGNIGDVCVELRRRQPSLNGRIINQDLPHVVTNTIEYPGVEKSAHDFWIPQTIKGMWLFQLGDAAHNVQAPRCII